MRKAVPRSTATVLAEFTRRPSSIRGLTNCFTGQLVYLVSGTQRNVVSSYIPVVGSLDRPEERGAQYASLKGGARYNFTSYNTCPVVACSQATSVEAGGASAISPIIEKPNFGALLEIRPTLISGDDTAIVDLRSTITVPGEQSASSDRTTAGGSLGPRSGSNRD